MNTIDSEVNGAAGADSDPLDVVRAYERRVAQIAERAADTKAQLASVRPTATSEHGEVTVTVSASGGLVDIEFGAAARSLELGELSSTIMRTVATARMQAAKQTEQAMVGLLGSSSKAMSFLRSQVPELVTPPAAEAAPTRVGFADDEDGGFRR